MENIDSYNWNDLYEKAENFIRKYIPNANVNRGTKTFYNGKASVDIIFFCKKEIRQLPKDSAKNYVSEVLAEST